MWEYRAKLNRIVDADTYDLNIDLGFKVYNTVRVRLTNPPIDAPEKNTLQGKEAIVKVTDLLLEDATREEWNLTLQTEYDKTFDRFLGGVILSTGVNVGQWLLDNRFAKPWKK
jgi:hypothetical protein